MAPRSRRAASTARCSATSARHIDALTTPTPASSRARSASAQGSSACESMPSDWAALASGLPFTSNRCGVATAGSSDGASRATSRARLRIAREISPKRGSMHRNRRKAGCGLIWRICPSTRPRSDTARTPLGSSSGLRRSSTDGEQKLTLSSSTQPPVSSARSSAPSTHSKRPDVVVSCAARSAARSRRSRSTSLGATDDTPARRSRTAATRSSRGVDASCASVCAVDHVESSSVVAVVGDMPWPRGGSSSARTARSTSAPTRPSSALNVRLRSTCSKLPSSSVVSTPELTANSVRGCCISCASNRTSAVLPLAEGPVRSVIQPWRTAHASASSPPACDASRRSGVSESTSTADCDAARGTTMSPTTSTLGSRCTAGAAGKGASASRSTIVANSRHTLSRSACVRRRTR
eukprot:Unigene17388_Nuclearia_a/m.50898 Unigene17388_Nuclearia_a/g.50898  ORF Unigene17388_Nuclearia_a/g.50898 Unigene17388_Nuclearia_a/m.50898 type:complete len:409 (+) Unigene17388_Nuclearia_a:1024-2250(+)